VAAQRLPPGDADACTAAGITPLPKCAVAARPQSSNVESDDDIRYTLMGLEILETRGRRSRRRTWRGGGRTGLPPAFLFTAEEAALRNLFLLRGQFEPQKLTAEDLARVPYSMNP